MDIKQYSGHGQLVPYRSGGPVNARCLLVGILVLTFIILNRDLVNLDLSRVHSATHRLEPMVAVKPAAPSAPSGGPTHRTEPSGLSTLATRAEEPST